jgi:response regulator RpfG family c-di-GMP phosphodiesterase
VRRRSGQRPRLLCVDDEPGILDGLQLHLGRTFDVVTADNGPDALGLLKENPDGIAVVVSDMRMPRMSGTVVLREAKRIAPQAVRILLTGFADSDAAMRAVNEGQIFRFLSKPCPPDQLLSVCVAAVGRHRLLVAEQRVQEHAQYDALDALTDVLAANLPEAFTRAAERSDGVAALARAAHVGESRAAEIAAKLVGLTDTQMPESAALRLPQLAGVLEIVQSSWRRFDSVEADGPLPVAARMVRLITDFAELAATGVDHAAAVASLQRSTGVYDPELLETLARLSEA